MRVVVVYESMFGNTREVAAAVARAWDAAATPVAAVDADELARADLVVVGAPTHMLSLSRPRSRRAAGEAAAKPDSGLALEPGFDGRGVREWLADTGPSPRLAAVFDTRLHQPAFLGHAGRVTARRLRRRGTQLLMPPESFFVDKGNKLEPGELARAERWGAELARKLTVVTAGRGQP
jgi:hypothetical protein